MLWTKGDQLQGDKNYDDDDDDDDEGYNCYDDHDGEVERPAHQGRQ